MLFAETALTGVRRQSRLYKRTSNHSPGYYHYLVCSGAVSHELMLIICAHISIFFALINIQSIKSANEIVHKEISISSLLTQTDFFGRLDTVGTWKLETGMWKLPTSY